MGSFGGNKIKELLLEKKMSMRGLTRAADVTPMQISNIEQRFTKGSSELIFQIANALDTEVDQILHLADRVDSEVV